MSEGDRLVHQFAQVRRANELVVEPLDGVIALLVGYNPKHVGHAVAVGLPCRGWPTVGAGLRQLHLLRAGRLQRGSAAGHQGLQQLSSIRLSVLSPSAVRRRALRSMLVATNLVMRCHSSAQLRGIIVFGFVRRPNGVSFARR